MDNHYPYEKLGLFYLGRELSLEDGTPSPAPLLVKSKNFTTHAAIIGMTGSGKTGLGIGLIEEAIMDNIPSIVIDPKGDMGNLLLTFPELRPQDFEPWLDPAEAAKKELSLAAYSEQTAATWAEGLQRWGQGKERIRALKERTEMTIYTPGSSSGISLSVLSGFTAPDEAVIEDTDTLNDLVSSTVTGLLALVDIQGDPLQSREHILLSSILLHFWRQGEDLGMERLIGAIVNPPFTKIGVFSLDTFYDQSDRMQLAMSLNNILASPSFAAWTLGEPFDIQALLYTAEGKPRTSIFSIAHLTESERMFFVTMLLNKLIGWMRRQQGVSSLKALLYMDEIFGYFPPTANPPSKKPMLLLLKQARAYGLGVILATQNPVDLDYKGLSNIGTWFVGRLQTTQDQQRVAEGIVGASDGKLSKSQVQQMLSSMKGRQFLLNSAHLDAPLLFETRWVLSFLKGPISQKDIQQLMAQQKEMSEELQSDAAAVGSPGAAVGGPNDHPPVLPEGIGQYFFLHNSTGESAVFEPWLAARGFVRFYNARRNIDEVKEIACRLYLDDRFDRPHWESGEEDPCSLQECVRRPPASCSYYPVPATISELTDLRGYEKDFADFLYQNERLELLRAPALKLESRPGESGGEFHVRLADLLREKKEEAIEKLRQKYAVREKRLSDKIERALDRVEKEKLDVTSKTTDTIISFGVAAIGALFGRKALSSSTVSRTATGMRNVGRVAKERNDVKRAEEEVVELQQELDQLTREIEEKIETLADSFVPENYAVETFAIKPRRSDIFDLQLYLLWEMTASRQMQQAAE